MEEKKKKKFIIPLPYTGGNLGKTLMFGLVIVLAVVGAMMLQAKELTQIQEDGYVVEEELSDALKNGVTDPVSQDEVELYAVSAWQKVYSRMGSLYVGEEQAENSRRPIRNFWKAVPASGFSMMRQLSLVRI